MDAPGERSSTLITQEPDLVHQPGAASQSAKSAAAVIPAQASMCDFHTCMLTPFTLVVQTAAHQLY